jgi:integrase
VDLTLKVVSERLGHSSPAFTMSVYQHVLPGMQRDAAELFTKLVITDEDDGLWCR